MTETFLQMAQRHRDADILAQGQFEMKGGKACSVGCFNHDLGNKPPDFAALAAFSGYPEWVHHLQEAIFEGLPEDDAREWHVQFAEKCATVADWNAFYRANMVGILLIALPHDTSEKQVVQWAIDLHSRDDVPDAEWQDLRRSARAAAWDAGAARSARSAGAAAEAAAEADAWADAEAAARAAARAARAAAWDAGAAWAAARAARAAAWDAGAAARAAARAARAAAWDAGAAARAAARADAYRRMRDNFLSA